MFNHRKERKNRAAEPQNQDIIIQNILRGWKANMINCKLHVVNSTYQLPIHLKKFIMTSLADYI